MHHCACSQLSDFLPVLKLYDLLYPDQTSIAVPDVTQAGSTHTVAATCIWIHLNMKATSDNVQLQRPIPYALREHQEALGQLGQHLESVHTTTPALWVARIYNITVASTPRVSAYNYTCIMGC